MASGRADLSASNDRDLLGELITAAKERARV